MIISKVLNSLSLKNNKYDLQERNAACSEFEVNKWVISKFVVEKILPIAGYTPYPLDELILLVGSVCHFKPTHIFEWGTHVGKSARIFYETIEGFDICSNIYSFDLPDNVEHVEHPHEKRGMLVKGLKKVHLFQTDGLAGSFDIFNKSPQKDKKALFYLDGDHSYETVYRELSTILKTIPEAVVLLHDTFFQSEEAKYNTGPYSAINDVLNKMPGSYKKIVTGMGLPGMTLVYRN